MKSRLSKVEVFKCYSPHVLAGIYKVGASKPGEGAGGTDLPLFLHKIICFTIFLHFAAEEGNVEEPLPIRSYSKSIEIML